ncbi:NAD(P)-dependent oxidoreductase [Haloarcula japonica]|uniref:NAD-dependent epimerase/dehydratase n=1 Tax=Haloarcula japonica (strain ATCC 49778 / DSM 6131 / JCM 7785 / NBRC 101032 / NCIMB 13157 / TR-1) TaxID=1227453 RepID=M0L249_HALJT|nr:NAD(P)H-binding protein [Haloarcula japonica]EMA27178.1 NAD-dependent epimerase/dehydratase [Haloarcula japonica DSM 6131]
MDVLLLGASGRIGQRTAAELLERGHSVTGVSRSGTVEGIDSDEFVAVAGDATDPGDIAKLATGHDAVVSALGPSDDESAEVLTEMISAVVDGLRHSGVDRLVWTGGAGGLRVGPETLLIETEDFPAEWEPVARAAIEAYDILSEADDLAWTYVAPAALIEPGERTGQYRTAERELVADEEGDSYISMEDFAIALVDELEAENAVHTYLGTGY